MLKRFLKIKDPADKTLTKLRQQKTFQRRLYQLLSQFLAVKELLIVLLLLETAIKELSKNSATFLTAESVYKFIFESLDQLQMNKSKNLSKQI